MEEALHPFRNDITKGSVTLPVPLVIEAVFFPQVLDGDNGCVHGSMQGLNTEADDVLPGGHHHSSRLLSDRSVLDDVADRPGIKLRFRLRRRSCVRCAGSTRCRTKGTARSSRLKWRACAGPAV